MRCFIAVRVEPTEELRRALSKLEMIGRAIRPVRLEHLHITLRFLGEITAEQQGGIVEAMRAAATGMSGFDLGLKDVGLLPDARRPTVLWVGGDRAGAQKLEEFVQRLSPGLAPLGFAPESRPWRCHMTIARIKARPPVELDAFLTANRGREFGTAPVRSIDLMVSKLLPAGPEYSVAGSVELGGP